MVRDFLYIAPVGSASIASHALSPLRSSSGGNLPLPLEPAASSPRWWKCRISAQVAMILPLSIRDRTGCGVRASSPVQRPRRRRFSSRRKHMRLAKSHAPRSLTEAEKFTALDEVCVCTQFAQVLPPAQRHSSNSFTTSPCAPGASCDAVESPEADSNGSESESLPFLKQQRR